MTYKTMTFWLIVTLSVPFFLECCWDKRKLTAIPESRVCYIPVSKFGALPDSSADATQSIQDAVDFAFRLQQIDTGIQTIVTFDKGVYLMSKPVTFKANIGLNGFAARLLPNCCDTDTIGVDIVSSIDSSFSPIVEHSHIPKK